MTRLSSAVLVLVALVGLSTAFNLTQFTARLSGRPYAAEAVKRVKAVERAIESLPTAEQTLLDQCLQSAALNSEDDSATIQEFFNEVAGCLNVNTNVPANVTNLLSQMNEGL